MKTQRKSNTNNPFMVMIILVIAAFTITSCSNDDLIPNSELGMGKEHPESIDKDPVDGTGDAPAKICWKCIGEVAGADLLGAGMGFLNGAGGGPYVAGGSAVVYGVMSSVAATAIFVDDQDDNGKESFLHSLKEYRPESLRNPNDNPYQEIGQRHNELLQEMLLTHFTEGEADMIKILSQAKLTDMERELAFSPKGSPLDWLKKLLEDILKPIGGPWLMGTNHTDTEKILDQYSADTYKVTTEFFNAVEGVESLEEYQKELDAFEANFLKNQHSLKKEEVQQILVELAVARYSSHFWFSVLAQ